MAKRLRYVVPCQCGEHYKTTLNALNFKQAYQTRTDLVKDAMSLVPVG
jgi:arsenite oxidase large subunit